MPSITQNTGSQDEISELPLTAPEPERPARQLTSTSTAHHTRDLPLGRSPRSGDDTGTEGVQGQQSTVRRRGALPASSATVAETGPAKLTRRLREVAGPGVSEPQLQIAHTAATVLYGDKAGRVPRDVLASLIERAPLFEKHRVTTDKQMKSFLSHSFAEWVSPFLGRSGYAMLPAYAKFLGAAVPAPATGLAIGGATMGTTINTISAREGLETQHSVPLELAHLPPSVQARHDAYASTLAPAGVRPEVNRQMVRAMVTLVPALVAMARHEPMDHTAVVNNDVYADTATFVGAEYLDTALANGMTGLKNLFNSVTRSGKKLKEQGIDAPSHGELIAHQPLALLEQRLVNHNKGWVEAGVDAAKAAGSGVWKLWSEQTTRVPGIAAHAGLIIFCALNVTSQLIASDPQNKDLPEGKITPRSALAIPAGLIITEFFATEAFDTLMKTCDSMMKGWKRSPVATLEDTEAHVEELEPEDEHGRESGEEMMPVRTREQSAPSTDTRADTRADTRTDTRTEPAALRDSPQPRPSPSRETAQ